MPEAGTVSVVTLADARAAVVADTSLVGSAFCSALTSVVDGWLIELYREHVGDRSGVALVAVGGYGREELCPHSDLDVLLLHAIEESDVSDIASQLWYPIWDEGVKLGHSVRTVDEAMALAKEDLDTATSLLSARFLTGDRQLADKLHRSAMQSWRRHGSRWLNVIEESARERHRRCGQVAFMLEPDLKSGRGGLRDVRTVGWAALADRSSDPEDHEFDDPYELLLRARVELHRATGRRGGDVLLLEQQDAVAEAMGYGDADLLMADISAAARRIAWHSDEVWTRILDSRHRKKRSLLRRRSPVVVGGPGVTVTENRVHLAESAEVTPAAVLRLAAAAAHHDARLSASTIDRLEHSDLLVPDPWTDELRKLFVDVWHAGHRAIPVIETLDQLGLFVPFIPEWAPNRSRPQRNAYHRFTVDRHLWEAAAEAAAFVDEVDRPDLLLIGALLHDVGKGYPGDHTEVGMELIQTIATRMGFPAEDVATLIAMCEHHLLLPDAATRRDLDDDDTIHGVADAVGSTRVLWLLRALTEADSIATGPSAWSRWKAGLVRDLAARVEFVLEGGDAGELPRNFPTEEHREAMRRGTVGVKGEGELLTVLAINRPGVFSRVAGAVSLNGLDVLDAAAHTEYGIAIAMFRLQPAELHDDIDWDRLCTSVEDALLGRVALAARIHERIRTYERGSTTGQHRIVETSITIDNNSSSTSTIVEVAAPNRIGLLYFVTRALSQLDLDISSAKCQTLGGDVVDSFYLRDRDGNKLEDGPLLKEVARALEHAAGLTTVRYEDDDG